jgi:hypothetical protein
VWRVGQALRDFELSGAQRLRFSSVGISFFVTNVGGKVRGIPPF